MIFSKLTFFPEKSLFSKTYQLVSMKMCTLDELFMINKIKEAFYDILFIFFLRNLELYLPHSRMGWPNEMSRVFSLRCLLHCDYQSLRFFTKICVIYFPSCLAIFTTRSPPAPFYAEDLLTQEEHCHTSLMVIKNHSHSFHGGSTKNNIGHWQNITSDSWVLEQVQGVWPHFIFKQRQFFRPKQFVWSEVEFKIIDTELDILLHKGAAETEVMVSQLCLMCGST